LNLQFLRYYRPAEIIFGSQIYGKNVDIWSLGCVMAEAFLGRFLFEGGTDIEQLSQIFQLLGPPNVINNFQNSF
jgi:serine/threonine protein kinase